MRFTENTLTRLELIPGRSYTMFIAGSFGGGHVTLSLTDATISGAMILPGYQLIMASTAFVFTAPAQHLSMDLRYANSPDIVIDCILRPL